MKVELIGYYLMLAIRSMKERYVVSTLMVLTLGVGIGCAAAAYALIRAASANPVPEISNQLLFPVLETGAVRTRGPRPSALWSYPDYLSLSRSGLREVRFSANYPINPVVVQPDGQGRPHHVLGQAVSQSFFHTVGADFAFGGPWSFDGDVRDVVISGSLNQHIFNGSNSVGRVIALDGRTFRVAGVLGNFDPTPKFYNLDGYAFSGRDEVFIPLESAIDAGISSSGNIRCPERIGEGMKALVASRCEWISVIARGDHTASTGLALWLKNYASYRLRQGLDAELADAGVYGFADWMALQGAIPSDAIQLQIVCLGILSVSCANLIALLLSAFLRKERELGVRRALGATRFDIALQLTVESTVIGISSSLLGALLAMGGTSVIRRYVPAALAAHVRVDMQLLLLALVAGCLAAIASGAYPALRAATVNPVRQVKMS
jgi:putative ABC transport system permease protein